MNTKLFIKPICIMLVLCSGLGSCAFGKKNGTSVSSELDTSVTEEVASDIPVDTEDKDDNTSETETENENKSETNADIELQRPSLNIPGITTGATTEPSVSETESETAAPSEKPVDNDLPYADEIGVFVPYDVPLSIEQQKIVEKVAARFNVHEELVYGVMYCESKYNQWATSKNGKYIGIMQIAKSNLSLFKKKNLNITDLYDFEQNITGGCYFLGHYAVRYNHNSSLMLLRYHGTNDYFIQVTQSGKTGDAYTEKAIREMNRIIEARKLKAAEMGVKIKGWLYEY